MVFFYKHIGLYGFTREVLSQIHGLPVSPLESLEQLEQLSWLESDIAIRVLETEETGPGVDTPECLVHVRDIITGDSPVSEKPLSLENVRLVILDVDGVLITSGELNYGPNGEHFKQFYIRDGLGIKMLEHNGITVAVASGKESPSLMPRLDDLGIDIRVLGEIDKKKACRKIMRRLNISPSETVYIAGDTIDLPAFEVCGHSFTVGDSPEYIQEAATYCLKSKGGCGAVREVADMLLEAQEKSALYKTARGFLGMVSDAVQ